MKQKVVTANQVGHILMSQRKSLKLSQEDMSKFLGVSQNRYSELENNPRRITLDRLLVLLNNLDLELTIQLKEKPIESEW